MIRKICNRTVYLFWKKENLITVTLLFLIVSINYIGNIVEFMGYDVSQMYQPMKLILISFNRVNYNADITLLLVMIYPVLVTMPSGFSYADDHLTQEEIYIVQRVGKRRYLRLCLISSFLVASITFFLPLLTDVIFHWLSFPMDAMNDFTNLKIYSKEYISLVKKYQFSGLYLSSSVLYAIVGGLVFSVISGLLNTLTVAISFLLRVKYRFLLFLPNWFILNLTSYFDNHFHQKGVSHAWYEYMLIFSESVKSGIYSVAVVVLIVALIVFLYNIAVKKDLTL